MSGGWIVSTGPKAEVRRLHEERDIQKQVVQMLGWALPDNATYWSCPNEGKRSRASRGIMNGMGLRAGQPDLEIIWDGRWYGFELKTPKGGLSSIQKQRHGQLKRAGGPVFVCRSDVEVEAVLRELGMPLKIRPTSKPVDKQRDLL